jgi:nitrite reductase/ring-hydroxylating ferredoxin subunit
MGTLKDNVVICPMHGARIDIKTGKKISDPNTQSINTDSLPSNLQKYMQYVGQILFRIKTYDQKTYEVKVEDNRVKVRVSPASMNTTYLGSIKIHQCLIINN